MSYPVIGHDGLSSEITYVILRDNDELSADRS